MSFVKKDNRGKRIYRPFFGRTEEYLGCANSMDGKTHTSTYYVSLYLFWFRIDQYVENRCEPGIGSYVYSQS